MYYEINVSYRGAHFFATAKRSITCKEQADQVWKELRKRFPATDGFDMTCTRYVTSGETLKMDQE